MDLDRGRDGDFTYPSRYLLVGSSGFACSIALYNLSYFWSDMHLNHCDDDDGNYDDDRQQNGKKNDC